jgi:hypothetical protein
VQSRVSKNVPILLANLLPGSSSTFSWGNLLSFFAFRVHSGGAILADSAVTTSIGRMVGQTEDRNMSAPLRHPPYQGQYGCAYRHGSSWGSVRSCWLDVRPPKRNCARRLPQSWAMRPQTSLSAICGRMASIPFTERRLPRGNTLVQLRLGCQRS